MAECPSGPQQPPMTRSPSRSSVARILRGSSEPDTQAIGGGVPRQASAAPPMTRKILWTYRGRIDGEVWPKILRGSSEPQTPNQRWWSAPAGLSSPSDDEEPKIDTPNLQPCDCLKSDSLETTGGGVPKRASAVPPMTMSSRSPSRSPSRVVAPPPPPAGEHPSRR